jgi:hypothetical protein
MTTTSAPRYSAILRFSRDNTPQPRSPYDPEQLVDEARLVLLQGSRWGTGNRSETCERPLLLVLEKGWRLIKRPSVPDRTLWTSSHGQLDHALPRETTLQDERDEPVEREGDRSEGCEGTFLAVGSVG